jgi:hypothetical protein
LKEKDNEIDKLKKINENMIKFKNERENLILENSKLSSDTNRLKYDLEETKTLIERQNVLLKNKEDLIIKMNEEISYLTFNTKKLKSDSDRALQDAIVYQQITRKMEKDLAECQVKKEKLEKELNIIKQQIYKNNI